MVAANNYDIVSTANSGSNAASTVHSKKKKRKKSITAPVIKQTRHYYRSLTKDDIVISLRNKDYERVMHNEFRAMEVNQEKMPIIAERIFGKFKAQLQNNSNGGTFLKKVGTDTYEAIDDESEVLKMIKTSLQNRRQSAKSWGVVSPEKNGKEGTAAAATAASKPDDIDEASLETPSKKQKKSNSTSTTPSNNSRRTRNSSLPLNPSHALVGGAKQNPLAYVGMFISDLLRKDEGWEMKEKKIGHDFAQVFFKPGCDNKATAEEGVDKFTGYVALAKHMYETGYFRTHVVDTEQGQRILEKAKIADNPYSIFQSDNNPHNNNHDDELQGDDGHLKPAAVSPDSSTAQMKVDDDDDADMSKFCSKDTQEYLEIAERIETNFDAAKAKKDKASIDFYRHLLLYLGEKAKQQNFSLDGAEKDIITNAMKCYEAKKEKLDEAVLKDSPMKDIYSNLLTHIVNSCKEKLPLSP